MDGEDVDGGRVSSHKWFTLRAPAGKKIGRTYNIYITSLRSLKYCVVRPWAGPDNELDTKLVHLNRILIIPLVSSPSLPSWSGGHWLANGGMTCLTSHQSNEGSRDRKHF